jgi:hypothetical protein
MILKNITIGADPELFIYNTKTQKVVSSIGIIPGEKDNAYTKGMPEGHGLQIDNILGEFNVPPVSIDDNNGFVENIEYAKDFIRKFVKKKNKDLDILCKASMYVDEDQLQSEEARMFGCSADYNAYTMMQNEAPKGNETNLRTTGCHIHVGYQNPNTETSLQIVKYMDAFLGLASVLIDPDTERRKLYGKAGCFRLCDYGVEYRVLSGFFIESEEIINTTFKLVQASLKAYNCSWSIPSSKNTIKAINNVDKELAGSLLKEMFSSSEIIMEVLKNYGK